MSCHQTKRKPSMTTEGQDKAEEEDYVIDPHYLRIRWRKGGARRAYAIDGVSGLQPPAEKPDQKPELHLPDAKQMSVEGVIDLFRKLTGNRRRRRLRKRGGDGLLTERCA
jgi:hypothetical protein